MTSRLFLAKDGGGTATGIVFGCVAFVSVFALSLRVFPLLSRALGTGSLPSALDQARSYLLFWPQLALLPYGVVVEATSRSTQPQYIAVSGWWVWACWALAGLAFGAATRRRRIPTRIVWALPVAIVLVVLLHVVMRALGFAAVIDAP